MSKFANYLSVQNLPNLLTVGRLLILPVIVSLLIIDNFAGVLVSLGLYVFAAFTDWLDGYIARKYHAVSEFGAFFDPVSDKVFVAVMLITMTGTGRLDGWWIIVSSIILSREILVSAIREYMGKKGINVAVTGLAKWKTATQMIAIGFLIIGSHLSYVLECGQLLLFVSMVLTVITGYQYFRKSFSCNISDDLEDKK